MTFSHFFSLHLNLTLARCQSCVAKLSNWETLSQHDFASLRKQNGVCCDFSNTEPNRSHLTEQTNGQKSPSHVQWCPLKKQLLQWESCLQGCLGVEGKERNVMFWSMSCRMCEIQCFKHPSACCCPAQSSLLVWMLASPCTDSWHIGMHHQGNTATNTVWELVWSRKCEKKRSEFEDI